MKKRGQIKLSFGMIFSIILIIAIIAIAFYVISYFLDLGKCAEIGLFYQDLKERTDQAWNSEITRETFSGSLPKEIEAVCFGKLTQSSLGYQGEKEAIERIFRHSENNVFLYPSENSCGKESASFDLEHAESDNFFCAPVFNGNVEVRLVKESSDSLVKLEKS